MAAAFVYVARDGDGRVLYVGVTGELKARMAAHRRSSGWWSRQAQVHVEEFATIEAAERAETGRICRYDPAFNIRGGHGASASACAGRRWERVRAENLRLQEARRRRLLHQPRRRCAPPLHEWDVVCVEEPHEGPEEAAADERVAAENPQHHTLPR